MQNKKELIKELTDRIRTLPQDKLTRLQQILCKWQEGHQRKHPRFDATLDVDFVVRDRFFQCQATNISAGGIFISIDETFQTNEPLSIVIATSKKEKPFKLKGKIVRLTQEGIAVEFENVSPYFARILEDAILKDLPGSDVPG